DRCQTPAGAPVEPVQHGAAVARARRPQRPAGRDQQTSRSPPPRQRGAVRDLEPLGNHGEIRRDAARAAPGARRDHERGRNQRDHESERRREQRAPPPREAQAPPAADRRGPARTRCEVGLDALEERLDPGGLTAFGESHERVAQVVGHRVPSSSARRNTRRARTARARAVSSEQSTIAATLRNGSPSTSTSHSTARASGDKRRRSARSEGYVGSTASLRPPSHRSRTRRPIEARRRWLIASDSITRRRYAPRFSYSESGRTRIARTNA